jgi:hypothetical protein
MGRSIIVPPRRGEKRANASLRTGNEETAFVVGMRCHRNKVALAGSLKDIRRGFSNVGNRAGDMGFSTVLIISLAAGVILIVGGGLMMYMANLVKSAYEIKVQMSAEVEDKLTKMGEDLDKKSKWIKRDLIEEIEKIKTALETDNVRKLSDLSAALSARVEGFEALLRAERTEWVKAVESDRRDIVGLDMRLKAMGSRPIAKKPEEAPKLAEPTADGQPAEGAPAPAAAPAAAAPPPVKSGPTPVGDFLQELGSGTR